MKTQHRFVATLAALALVAAACGGGDSAPTEPTSDAPAVTNETPSVTAAPDPSAGAFVPIDGVGVQIAEGWTGLQLGQGTKPVLTLDPDGEPGIAFLLERITGSVSYLEAASGWEPETVAEGYFYGPIGLAYDASGAPVVAYHDHQAAQFQDDLGDMTIATRSNGVWTVGAIIDDGHDGWDSTIAAGPDGSLHAAGIDPEQFGRNVGVEYFELIDGDWQTTEIGTGPIAYEYNVALSVAPSGDPALAYYDNNAKTLNFAARAGGEWSIETVDDAGDPGRYSSLAFDSAGNPHLSYVDLLGPTAATVRHATNDGSGWAVSDVASLDEILTGFTGARRITHIQIDSEEVPHIVIGDEGGVWYATLERETWDVTQIAERGNLRLGQLVSFALDADDTPHVAFFEVTSSNPLDGTIVYMTPAG
jgi:ribosomal protein S18 acetylase RimI-like enzyme